MANKNLAQIFADNPITVIGDTDLLYVDQTATTDAGITGASIKAQFVSKDANSNLSANNFLSGYATTATAGATTTLTVASKYQQYFTGATTQTVLLPVTSTLVLGQSFYIVNNSSGVVTVESSGGNTIKAMAANTILMVTCILTSGTSAASWNYQYAIDQLALPLSVLNGGTGSATVVSAPTASAWAGWDSNSNLSANSLIEGYATTATAAATTTLTVASKFQQYFTGATTQTVVLPVTSTLVLGQAFLVVNNSSGIVTVQSSGANTVLALAAGQQSLFTCILTSGTSAASWSYSPVVSASSSPWVAGAGTGSAKGGDGSETAAGDYSLSYGTAGTKAPGISAMAIGNNAGAQGDYSFSFGNNANLHVGCDYSFVFGHNASTENNCLSAFSFGSGTDAGANYAMAFGQTCSAFSVNSMAFGNGCVTQASGGVGYGMAFGNASTAYAYSLAFGHQSTAGSSGTSYNVAIGNQAQSNNSGSWCIADSQGTPNQDTAGDQFVATFAGGYYLYTGANLSITTAPTTGATSILGTKTVSNASAGFVGEFITSNIPSGSAVSLTTLTAANVTSISLTAGDWDVWGNVSFAPSVACSLGDAWISLTSATQPDYSLYSGSSGTSALFTFLGVTCPTIRVNVSTTTTVYLSGISIFAAGTMAAAGTISARRVR